MNVYREPNRRDQQQQQHKSKQQQQQYHPSEGRRGSSLIQTGSRSPLPGNRSESQLTPRELALVRQALHSAKPITHTCGKDVAAAASVSHETNGANFIHGDVNNNIVSSPEIPINYDDERSFSYISHDLSDCSKTTDVNYNEGKMPKGGDLNDRKQVADERLTDILEENRTAYKKISQLRAELDSMTSTNKTLSDLNRQLQCQTENVRRFFTNTISNLQQSIQDICFKLETQKGTTTEREQVVRQMVGLIKAIPRRLNDGLLAQKSFPVPNPEIRVNEDVESGDIAPQTTFLCARLPVNNKVPGVQHSIKVICRIKPDVSNCLSVPTPSTVYLPQFRHFSTGIGFQLGRVMPGSTSQSALFDEVSPILEACFTGCNVCILTYGQSGSGKTYTMMGLPEDPGLIVRCMGGLRSRASYFSGADNTQYRFHVSVLEVYNEVIYDLLGSSVDAGGVGVKSRVIIQDNGQSVQIKNVSEAEVSDERELAYHIERSQARRTNAVTSKNQSSSRSHFLVMMRISGTSSATSQQPRQTTNRGVLILCDLAGSENCDGLNPREQNESRYINKSILMLTSVFDALYKRLPLIPFRDSKLTHLLKPSLMGNAKCVFIATICGLKENLIDTYRTLNVAKKVEMITFSNRVQ